MPYTLILVQNDNDEGTSRATDYLLPTALHEIAPKGFYQVARIHALEENRQVSPDQVRALLHAKLDSILLAMAHKMLEAEQEKP